MIPAQDMGAYRSQLSALSERARAATLAALRHALDGADPSALDVAGARDDAIAAANDVLSVYAVAGASVACDFSERHGLPPQTMTDIDRRAVERVVRYQAGKLSEGDIDGFIEQVGSFAADSVYRAANGQQMRAAQRGRKARGKDPAARFARVPSGAETCTFCRMLASRGFVYWSRETAGELDHFHRNCDCLVIASNDPDGIEGYDPDREYALWRAFEEIDEGEGTKAEKDAAKRAALEASASSSNHLGGAARGKPMSFKEADSCHVNPLYGSAHGYSINCQSCVVAFEARLRGYDVITRPNTKGSVAERLSYRTNLAWIDPETGAHPDYIVNHEANTPLRYLKFMKSQVKPGERYTLQFVWKGREWNGHIVNLDLTEDGELRIKDNQRGPNELSEWVGDEQVLSYLREFKFKGRRNRRLFTGLTKMLRIDNMEFDEDIANGILGVLPNGRQ